MGKAKKDQQAAAAYLHAHGLDLGVSADLLGDMVLHAVERLDSSVHREPEYELADAEVLVLKEGGFDLSGRTLGRSDPVAQSVAEFAALLETALTTREAAEKLGVNASRIRQRLGEGTLYGIRVSSEWRLPRFQFVEGGLLPGFEQVIARIDREEIHPVALYRWLTTPSPDLYAEDVGTELSPRRWLASGRPVEPVARMASHL